jgi:hypothetical protein
MLLRSLSAALQSFASKPRLAPLETLASLPSKPNCLTDDFAVAKPLRCWINHYQRDTLISPRKNIYQKLGLCIENESYFLT